VVCKDLKTEKKEINKNTKSNQIHQVGADEQQLLVQAEAININGVATQCTKHNALAEAPIKSDFCFIALIIK
jgi:hypothetical protein